MPVRGPAATAGIEVCDVITALDDVPITGANDLLCRLAAKQPGDVVSVRVTRDHRTFSVTATLERWPADQCAAPVTCGQTASADQRRFSTPCATRAVSTPV